MAPCPDDFGPDLIMMRFRLQHGVKDGGDFRMLAVPAGHVGKAGLTGRQPHGGPGDRHFAKVERIAKPPHSPADQDKARLW